MLPPCAVMPAARASGAAATRTNLTRRVCVMWAPPKKCAAIVAPSPSARGGEYLSECIGEHHRRQEAADAERQQRHQTLRIKAAGAAENEPDDQIEAPPEHVADRWRHSLTRRGRKRSRKKTARDAVGEVRHGIDEKGACEEQRQVVIPAHMGSFYFFAVVVLNSPQWLTATADSSRRRAELQAKTSAVQCERNDG